MNPLLGSTAHSVSLPSKGCACTEGKTERISSTCRHVRVGYNPCSASPPSRSCACIKQETISGSSTFRQAGLGFSACSASPPSRSCACTEEKREISGSAGRHAGMVLGVCSAMCGAMPRPSMTTGYRRTSVGQALLGDWTQPHQKAAGAARSILIGSDAMKLEQRSQAARKTVPSKFVSRWVSTLGMRLRSDRLAVQLAKPLENRNELFGPLWSGSIPRQSTIWYRRTGVGQALLGDWTRLHQKAEGAARSNVIHPPCGSRAMRIQLVPSTPDQRKRAGQPLFGDGVWIYLKAANSARGNGSSTSHPPCGDGTMRPPPATARSGQRERAAQPLPEVTLISGSLTGGLAKAGWGNGRDTVGRDKGGEDSVLTASDRWVGKPQSTRKARGQSEGPSKDRNGWRGGQLAATLGGELKGEGTAS